MLRNFMFSLLTGARYSTRPQCTNNCNASPGEVLARPPNPDTIPNPAVEKKREANEEEQEPRARRGRPPEIALAPSCDARVHGRRRPGRRQPRQDQHLQPAVRGDVAPPAAGPFLREGRGRPQFRSRAAERPQSVPRQGERALFASRP